MTEDMLQEHAEVLTQLGTTQEGTRVRAQMQSASLLSDMEAFKVSLFIQSFIHTVTYSFAYIHSFMHAFIE